MSERRKPIVGETLIAEETRRGFGPIRKTLTVTKVGRKYFDAVHEENGHKYNQGPFDIRTWQRTGNWAYNRPIFIAETEQDFLDRDEKNSICDTLGRSYCYLRDWHKLPLDKLRRIKAIIDEPQ